MNVAESARNPGVIGTLAARILREFGYPRFAKHWHSQWHPAELEELAGV